MSITSIQFLTLFGISLLIYYIFPLKIRWFLLLVYTVVFFVLSSTPWTIIYIITNVIITYISTRLIIKFSEENRQKSSSIVMLLGIAGNVVMLAVLKYSNFGISIINDIFKILKIDNAVNTIDFISPIGISYYTLISVGYILDCYWKICVPEKNILKTALFVSYYPQLTSGPITRYDEMKNQLFGYNKFSYKNLAFGCQRIMWGFFKKIVVSSRVGLIVDGIYSDIEMYSGLYIWIAAFLFMLQLYTDFSGCMDIIMGASECYGIKLPENFRTPFSSTSVQEYWQRWHITLGSWFKDYIMYPVLRSKNMNKLSKWLKVKFGKKASRQISAYLAMLCVWILIGIWHGGHWKYILGMGLWFWLCIVINQVLQPIYKKIIGILKIDITLFSCHLLLSVKVFILVAIGNMFFRLKNLHTALHAIILSFKQFNPWILFDGSILKFGVTYTDLNIIICGLVAILMVGILQEKYLSAREWIQKQVFIFRWIIWLCLFAAIIVYGMYGPGYSAAEFIYRGF